MVTDGCDLPSRGTICGVTVCAHVCVCVCVHVLMCSVLTITS